MLLVILINSDLHRMKYFTLEECFYHLCLNKRLNKQSWGWCFETPSCSLWRHCYGRCQLLTKCHPEDVDKSVRLTPILHNVPSGNNRLISVTFCATDIQEQDKFQHWWCWYRNIPGGLRLRLRLRLRQSLFNKNIYKYHIRFTWVS